ncbi:MAG: ComEC/Rec2 family competence protein [Campylobacterota bacterium]|nr:ComEC/Rec2 family competence protein [Campylobacterota bacterium]
MLLEKLSLFNTKKEFFIFLMACGFVLCYSLLIEFNNYKNLTQFDSNIVTATILKQYEKTKLTKKGKTKTYQVLKLKSEQGFSFYTTKKKTFPHAKAKRLKLEIWAGKITFYEFMTSFFSFSKVIHTYKTPTLKQDLNTHISSSHKNKDIVSIYQALYTATPLPRHLQQIFSTLGVSHLLAISGFHLGVLSTLLFFLLKTPYKFLQNRFVPYRSYKVDSFIIISLSLLGYLLFLETPASILRAFVMLVIGFVLYDRGYKIISMWTLFLTAILILSFFPRLFFSLGFWLSVSGVFYIFLFLIHFKHLHKIWQFVLVPVWVYIMMLPPSLFIFENFSLYHPLSIIWTSLFTLFYPLSIFLHLIGFGDFLDRSLIWLLNLSADNYNISISWHVGILFILTSLLAIRNILFTYILTLMSISIFIYSIYIGKL